MAPPHPAGTAGAAGSSAAAGAAGVSQTSGDTLSEGDEDMAVVVVDKAGDKQFISSPQLWPRGISLRKNCLSTPDPHTIASWTQTTPATAGKEGQTKSD